MLQLEIATKRREDMMDITARVRDAALAANWQAGAILLFCPHTTCGLTINEGADPAVRADLISFFRALAPRDASWQHLEGNSDAHIRSSLLGVSLLVPLDAGEIRLGRWQSIYLYEGDGPRRRAIWLQHLS